MRPHLLRFRRLVLVGVAAVGLAAGATACSSSGTAPVADSPTTTPVHKSNCGQQTAARSVSLEARHQEIIKAEPCLRAHGITIAMNGPNPSTDREDITVLKLTPAKSAYLDRLFGAQNTTLTTTNTLPCGCDATPSTPGLDAPSVKAP